LQPGRERTPASPRGCRVRRGCGVHKPLMKLSNTSNR
jgi:hypothetical protein